MAIDFTGHCAFPPAETQRRIAFLRRTRSDWFGDTFHLTDARDLGRFGHEIALTFGIDAACSFGLYLLNNEWATATHDAVEYIYRVFGTEHLVVTYGMDSIRPPQQQYPAMPID